MHTNTIKGIMAIGAASVKSDCVGYKDIACSNLINAVDSAKYLSEKFPGYKFRVYGPKGKEITAYMEGAEV